MTDLWSSLYLADFVLVILYMITMINHMYKASKHFGERTYRYFWPVGLELINITFLFHWFNARHGSTLNIWNTGAVLGCPAWFWLLEPGGLILFIWIGRRGKIMAPVLDNDSIAEAILYLPSGLCFSQPNGRIVLENLRMQDVWYDGTGKIIKDAEVAWRLLQEQVSEDGLLRTESGKVWRVKRAFMKVSGQTIVRMKADDVTELDRLQQELDLANIMLEEQNRKTKLLLKNIVRVNEEEESLDLQRKIHHEVGQCIISAKHYLMGQDKEKNREGLLQMWERTFSGDGVTEDKKDMREREREICEAATIGGCEVLFRGGRPDGEEPYLLYLAAVREAVTNAIWHAQATKVYVDGIQQNNELMVSVTSDGIPPEGPIVEGIGLGKLREKLERAGVRMEILWKKGVELRIYFPGKQGETK